MVSMSPAISTWPTPYRAGIFEGAFIDAASNAEAVRALRGSTPAIRAA